VTDVSTKVPVPAEARVPMEFMPLEMVLTEVMSMEAMSMEAMPKMSMEMMSGEMMTVQAVMKRVDHDARRAVEHRPAMDHHRRREEHDRRPADGDCDADSATIGAAFLDWERHRGEHRSGNCDRLCVHGDLLGAALAGASWYQASAAAARMQ
jgi:hypothetical protein